MVWGLYGLTRGNYKNDLNSVEVIGEKNKLKIGQLLNYKTQRLCLVVK